MREPGETVGRYEIVRPLGRGGMAVVHLARDTHLDRTVALKELNVLGSEQPDMAQRFVREARLSGSLGHSSIVHVNDFFEHEGTPFIDMEYVAGGSLRPHVGHMTFAQIVGVLEAMLDALDHAEQQGIVHRDLKPENVLVAPDGRVKIADFGIAKAINRVNASGFLTATGTAIGTPPYMAPEQGMARDIGPWTDLYAVGCMTHEFVTGRLPFVDPHNDEAAPMAILVRRISEPAPPVRTLNDRVPEALAAWIDGLLVTDPNARTRSASDASDKLEDIVIELVGARRRRTARLPLHAVDHDVDPVAITTGASRPASSGAAQPSETSPEGTADRGVDAQVSVEHGDLQSELDPATSLATPPPDDAIPGPYTPIPEDALPGPLTTSPESAIPDAIPGPYTPPPGDAIPGPDSLPPDDGFVTFGSPAGVPADLPDGPVAPPDEHPADGGDSRSPRRPTKAPPTARMKRSHPPGAGHRLRDGSRAPVRDVSRAPAAAAADRAGTGMGHRARARAGAGALAGTRACAGAGARSWNPTHPHDRRQSPRDAPPPTSAPRSRSRRPRHRRVPPSRTPRSRTAPRTGTGADGGSASASASWRCSRLPATSWRRHDSIGWR